MIGRGSRLSVGIGLVPVLGKATVVAVSNQVCSEAMGAGRISERMIRAGARGTDTCQVLEGGISGHLVTLCRGIVGDP